MYRLQTEYVRNVSGPCTLNTIMDAIMLFYYHTLSSKTMFATNEFVNNGKKNSIMQYDCYCARSLPNGHAQFLDIRAQMAIDMR